MSNRRRDVQSLKFFSAVKALVVMGLVTAVGMGLFMQSNNLVRRGEELAAHEANLTRLRQEIASNRATLARLMSPEMLSRRVAEMRLGLEEIRQEQIVRMYDAPSAERERVARMAAAGGVR